MALKSTQRSESPVTLCLILLLSIAFLSPLYHSHDYTEDYHQENNGDHVLIDNSSVRDSLSSSQQNNGPHLHIKKDIGRTDTHLRFESSSLTPDLCAVTESPAFTEYLSCTLIRHASALIFRSNSRACLTGLSPPAA